MDAAKAAISKFTSNKGHHTTVEEHVQPAVTRETIKPHRHEEATQAIDREVHQQHYHTTVQPLQHQEILPEKHTHNVLPTENREYRHDNERDTQQRLATELGNFKDTSRVEQTHHTTSAAPTVTGEHVHHHVHETVVPVIHKETIQPEVVHTTALVHETHHAAAQHHGLSALPMKTLDEFKSGGGKLTGHSGTREVSREEYDGAPRQYNDKLSTTFEKLGFGHGHHQQADSGVGGVGSHGTSGVGHQGVGHQGVGHQGMGQGVGGVGSHTTSGTGHHGVGTGAAGAGVAAAGVGAGAAAHHRRRGSNSSYSSSSDESVGGTRRKKDKLSRKAVGTGAAGGLGSGTSGSSTGQRTKPSLLDRLNPRKDADGDGKAGFGK